MQLIVTNHYTMTIDMAVDYIFWSSFKQMLWYAWKLIFVWRNLKMNISKGACTISTVKLLEVTWEQKKGLHVNCFFTNIISGCMLILNLFNKNFGMFKVIFKNCQLNGFKYLYMFLSSPFQSPSKFDELCINKLYLNIYFLSWMTLRV